MQSNSPRNYVLTSRTNKSTCRRNQATLGNIFRQNPSVQRKIYVHSSAIYPAVNQNVLLGQINAPYATRPQTIQQCQYSTALHPPMCYVHMSVPQQQRTTFIPGVGVANINQGQRTLGVTPFVPSTMLGVVNTTTTQSVVVAPLINMPRQLPPQQQPVKANQTKGKLRSHALEIIDPITKKNILDDWNIVNINSAGSSTTSSSRFEAHLESSLDLKICSSTTFSSTSNISILTQKTAAIKVLTPQTVDKITYSLDNKYKGEPNEENIKQVTEVSTATENFNCVQDSLPSNNYIKQEQQLPQQEQLKNINPEENISFRSLLPINISDDKTTISKEAASKESCSEESFAISSKIEKPINNKLAESRKTMQLGVKENLTIPQHKDINIADYNDNQGEDNSINGNSINANIRTLIESNDELLDTNNNDNKTSSNVNKTVSSDPTPTTATTTVKNYNKLDKKKKVKNTSGKSVIKGQAKSNKISNKSIKLKDITCNETIRNDALVIKQNIADVSKKTTTSMNSVASTKSTRQEQKQYENVNDVQESAAASVEKNEEEISNNTNIVVDNINQHIEPLIYVKIQYNREQLIELRGEKGSLIQPKLKNIAIFSLTKAKDKSIAENGSYQNSGLDSGHRISDKSMIYLNLSLDQEIKLKEADNAWRPKVLTKSTDIQVDPEQTAQHEKEELVRRVRGILNKLTPEKFESLVGDIIKLKIDTLDKMEAVMILVFEKAIDEPNFSVSYANLCYRLINKVDDRGKRMSSSTKMNPTAFRTALLNKTEHEFTQNVTKSDTKEEKLKVIREKIRNCKDATEKLELETLLDEEERKIRRRSGGTVRFIGELFKISILTGNIINNCIEALLKNPNEDMLECLCKLLTTVGQKFEQTNLPKNNERKYSLDTVIQRIQHIACKTGNLKVSSRVRFMLQDVIDLRKKNWQSTRNETPKTMDEIENEVNNAKLNNQYHYVNLTPGSNNEGRNYVDVQAQRSKIDIRTRQQGGINIGSHSHSDNSNDDDKWQVQTGKGNRAAVLFDSSKLVGMAVDMNNKKMGGVDLFNWNTTSSKPKATASNSFAELAMDLNTSSNRDVERDHSGTRNKSSYKKSSIKRDRFNHDRLLRQTGAQQATRDIFYHATKEISGFDGSSLSNMQKYSSHSKYKQPMSSFSMPKKSGAITDIGGGGGSGFNLYPGINTIQHQQQQDDKTAPIDLAPLMSVTQNEYVELTDVELKLFKSVVDEMVENAANSECMDTTTVSCIKKIKENQMCGLLYYILTNYLHLADVGPAFRKHLSNIVEYLIEKQYLSAQQFCLAYNNFFKLADELMIDIPELWLYVFEFTGPLLVKKRINIKDLWNMELSGIDLPSFSLKFLKTFLQYCTREVGPNFTRRIWKEHHLKWTYFMSENEVEKFIETNKFEYVEDESRQPPNINTKETKEKRNKRMVERIEQLLKEDNNADDIIDYINGNINDLDKSFVKSLTTILTSFVIKHSNNCSLDSNCFQKVCIPVLLHYIDSKEDLELECLSAIQLLNRRLEQPKGLLESIYAELNEADVISEDTLISWRNSIEKSKY